MIAKLNFQFYFSNKKFKSQRSKCTWLLSRQNKKKQKAKSKRQLACIQKIFIASKLLLQFVFICSTSFQLETRKSSGWHRKTNQTNVRKSVASEG